MLTVRFLPFLCSGANEQPDFNTMVELEAGTSAGEPGILERAMMASPLSPDLLMAVDPREVNGGALLSFEENRKENNSAARGKSVAKKQQGNGKILDIQEPIDR